MKRKKTNVAMNQTGGTIFGLSLPTGHKGVGKQSGKRPAPRDGHSGLFYKGLFFVFGGDRHHMPFNDLTVLDLQSELGSKQDQ